MKLTGWSEQETKCKEQSKKPGSCEVHNAVSYLRAVFDDSI